MKGFIKELIVILGILGFFGYIAFFNFSKVTSQKTLSVARSIIKYPEAGNWDIQSRRNMCVFEYTICSPPPAVIQFTTVDEWTTIYFFFKDNLGVDGWETKSQIVTSVPSGIVLTKIKEDEAIFCQAYITKAEKGWFGQNEVKDKYEITITCFPTADALVK